MPLYIGRPPAGGEEGWRAGWRVAGWIGGVTVQKNIDSSDFPEPWAGSAEGEGASKRCWGGGGGEEKPPEMVEGC